jgi:peptidoglycan/xylan/chitin deacetylase (PgdA/CDA1 family)
MFYPVRTPWLIKKAYPTCTWDMPAEGNRLYLTFDDGPHEEVTAFVLEELARRKAKATFFTIGKNVERLPGLHQRILTEGHALGNHTYGHLNGWQVPDDVYMEDIRHASQWIHSSLFRPPYGRISRSQTRIVERQLGMRVIMWSLLSGDFDPELGSEKCLRTVIDRMRTGDIIVFHDSAKASKKLQYVLPRVMDEVGRRGWVCEKIA